MIQPQSSQDHVSPIKAPSASRPSMRGLRQPSIQDCMIAYGSRSNRSKRNLLSKHASSRDVLMRNPLSDDQTQSESSMYDFTTVSPRSVSLNSSNQGSITDLKPTLQDCMEAYGTPNRYRMNEHLNESMNLDRREYLLRKASSRRFGASSRNLMSPRKELYDI
jgi:hypothetical protein